MTGQRLHFKRHTWMEEQVRAIGRARFSIPYWPSLDKAISTCLESHSYVLVNEGNHSAICQWHIAEPGIPIAAFLLVCPPFSEDVQEYGLQHTPLAAMHEIAFVACAPGSEGKGYAKQLVRHVLQTTGPCWLHVDTVNMRAKKLYESLGMYEYAVQSDPYGSEGSLMVSESGWNAYLEIGAALFNASTRQFEQTFCGSILAPPCMAC
jgi:ribosomal protein S18 acetylase RimI-like enzyme